MTRGKRSGGKSCSVCTHPGRAEIDALLLNAASTYPAIIKRIKHAYPETPELTPASLSRHKNGHLLTQPITVVETDPETGEQQVGYITGHLTKAVEAPRDIVPVDDFPLPAALRVVIHAGLRNIATNPELVTPAVLMQAIDMARKMGIGEGKEDDVKEAWAEVGRRKKRRRKVTVEEEVEETESPAKAQPDEVVLDAEDWSVEDLKLLEVPDDDE